MKPLSRPLHDRFTQLPRFTHGGGFTAIVVRVIRVDPENSIDPKLAYLPQWIIGKVDREDFNRREARDREFLTEIDRLDRLIREAKALADFKQALPDDTTREAFTAAVAALNQE